MLVCTEMASSLQNLPFRSILASIPCPQGTHTLLGRHNDKGYSLLSRGGKAINDPLSRPSLPRAGSWSRCNPEGAQWLLNVFTLTAPNGLRCLRGLIMGRPLAAEPEGGSVGHVPSPRWPTRPPECEGHLSHEYSNTTT